MIFIISPSKTMQRADIVTAGSIPIFLEKSRNLLQILQGFDVLKLQELYKCSKKIAEENELRLRNIEEKSLAIYSYTGAQYKALDISSLLEHERQYVYNHTYIISGMFGILRPLDLIYMYRLPLETTLKEISLYQYWQESIMQIVQGKTIINLASQEYSKIIDARRANVIDILFYIQDAGKMRSPSMEVKKMRGIFLRYCAKNQIEDISELLHFNENGYVFQKEQSNSTQIVFIKE